MARKTFTLDWEGDGLAKATVKAVERAVNETMGACVEDAQPNTPVDTGNLRRSIRLEPAEVKGDDVEGVWGSFDVDYAIFIEAGTGRRSGHNMLRNAADREYPNLANRIKDRMPK